MTPADLSVSDVRRLWSLCKRDPGGCWLWTAACRKGYGQFKVGGKILAAHRCAYVIGHQACLLPGAVVMHSCDTPACINPAHLSAGTHADNAQDCSAKGRYNAEARRASQNRGAAAKTERWYRDRLPVILAEIAVRPVPQTVNSCADIYGYTHARKRLGHGLLVAGARHPSTQAMLMQ